MSWLSSIFGDRGATAIPKQFHVWVDEINALEAEYTQKTDEEIRAEIQTYKQSPELQHEDVGAYLDRILPRVFAMVREASKRTSGKRHFDVQLLGGIVLHKGNIAEMRTGEGKTLVATLPVALNAIAGRGVHVVTVNDYLARRDAVWMGEIYHFLGLSIGCLNHEASYVYDPKFKEGSSEDIKRDELGSFKVMQEFLRPCSRKDAYGADITYGTNNEYGFDWLRDNLESSEVSLRQRAHAFAVVDEVDSILIDEARTPLIISAPDDEAGDLYRTFAGIAPKLKKDTDYTVDEKARAVLVNDEGISKVEKMLGVSDIYTEKGIRYVRHLEQALRAESLFQKDRHYVVRDGGVIIVDEFTGRLMPGRRWSEGLHQAVEAKEGIQIQKESRTLATITFQNYFRMYDKLSGMTGTAETSAEEFTKVYGLDVMVVPTHRSMIRLDQKDRIYQTERGKFTAVAREVKERHKKGQPVLIGTASIEKNEILSEILRREGVPHNVLNAKNHEHEAEITAQAGKLGAVTLATNIAGRGVDIILGGTPPDLKEAEKVRELGGLFVLGTERHEARRIDNQLRGRSGRQGDPGESQFFLSLEDDLLRIFAPDRIKGLMGKLGIAEDEPIEAGLLSKAIEQAQTKIEGLHFDSRKHLLEYDDVLSKQRHSIYKTRREMLGAESDAIEKKIQDILSEFAHTFVETHRGEEGIDIQTMQSVLKTLFLKDEQSIVAIPEGIDVEEAVEHMFQEEYRARIASDKEAFLQNARALFLQIIDTLWRDHLEVMEYTRSSVGLRAYGQRDPLVEYKNEAHRLFKTFNANLASMFVENLFKIGIHAHIHAEPQKIITNEQKNVADTIVKNADGKTIGRNDPCPCGSGKKYKKCHGQ